LAFLIKPPTSIFQVVTIFSQKSLSQPVSGAVELDALFVWSTMHGLASILQTSAITTLALPPTVLAATVFHTLQRIGVALRAEIGPEGDRTRGEEPS
jgi:hypothetical protein